MLRCGNCGKTSCAQPVVISQTWMAKNGRMAVALAKYGLKPVNFTAQVDVTNYSVVEGRAWHPLSSGGRVWKVVSRVVPALDAAMMELSG